MFVLLGDGVIEVTVQAMDGVDIYIPGVGA